MSRGSIREYVEALRERYRKASRKEKGLILDEFTQVSGYHRKGAIRALGRGPTPPGVRRGRPRQYGREVREALKVAWEATDRMCGKRLRPFMSELAEVLQRHREMIVSPQVTEQLCCMSAATMDRLLRPYKGMRRPLSTTRPGNHLKGSIPIHLLRVG